MQFHPSEPLVIYNYTQHCQFDRVWNDVTRQCRGLIANLSTGEIVARPFPKFFNYGEHESEDLPVLDLEAECRVYDKLDGSLGILYPVGDSWAIATRGSFTSEQAIRGTELLQQHLETGWKPTEGYTYLFEIIYPENRIVVDYRGQEDLYILDIIENETGLSAVDLVWLNNWWPGPECEELSAWTLGEALALEPRENAEGVVAVYPETGLRVKIKQDDYVALHRIITGLSEKSVWRSLFEGKTIPEICEVLPDEFHTWTNRVACDFLEKKDTIRNQVLSVYNQIVFGNLTEGFTRKEFAEQVQQVKQEYRPYLFMLLDGREIDAAILKTLEPYGTGRSPVNLSEDTA